MCHATHAESTSPGSLHGLDPLPSCCQVCFLWHSRSSHLWRTPGSTRILYLYHVVLEQVIWNLLGWSFSILLHFSPDRSYQNLAKCLCTQHSFIVPWCLVFSSANCSTWSISSVGIVIASVCLVPSSKLNSFFSLTREAPHVAFKTNEHGQCWGPPGEFLCRVSNLQNLSQFLANAVLIPLAVMTFVNLSLPARKKGNQKQKRVAMALWTACIWSCYETICHPSCEEAKLSRI